MGVYSTMRPGIISFSFPVPSELSVEDGLAWIIDMAGEWGLKSLHTGKIPENKEKIKNIREKSEAWDIEIDLQAPREIFMLGRKDEGLARDLFAAQIELANQLGVRILRTGYGKLTLETSRFCPEISLEQHMDQIIHSLRIAAELLTGSDIVLAIENHCDFTGRQLAEILKAIDSPQIGAALDTANGYSVYCDPHDDVNALAPYTMTTHLKDMRIVDNYYPDMHNLPLIPVGCELGSGHVDIKDILRTLAKSCPYAKGLHLIVENWSPCIPPVRTPEEKLTFLKNSTRKLQQLLSELELETVKS